MKTHYRFFFLSFLFINSVFAQNKYEMKGKLVQYPHTAVRLMGFSAFDELLLSTCITDSAGCFSLRYPADYRGAAILRFDQSKSINLLLDRENFSLTWSAVEDLNTLTINHSIENEIFKRGSLLNVDIGKKQSALSYLIVQYADSPVQKSWLLNELDFQSKRMSCFLREQPSERYATGYLTLRKLVSDIPESVSSYPERIKQHESDFMNMDFSDQRLWTSGLMRDLFLNMCIMMESSANMDTVAKHINLSTDAWMGRLVADEKKLFTVSDFMFQLFESRSLFTSSAYLAKSMLNKYGTLTGDLRLRKYEQYGKMAVGNTTADIKFTEGLSLGDIRADFKLLVFVSSEIHKSNKEFQEFVDKYRYLKDTYNLEIVCVALADSTEGGKRPVLNAPFPVHSLDTQRQKKVEEDYCLYSTPSYFLLNNQLTILRKITSAAQLESCLKFFKNR